jgi:hypothetical protein
MAGPAHCTSKVAILLPSDGVVCRVIGHSLEKTLANKG